MGQQPRARPIEAEGVRRTAVRVADLVPRYADLLDLCDRKWAAQNMAPRSRANLRAWATRLFWHWQCRDLAPDRVAVSHLEDWYIGSSRGKRRSTMRVLAGAANRILSTLEAEGIVAEGLRMPRQVGGRPPLTVSRPRDHEMEALDGAAEAMRAGPRACGVAAWVAYRLLRNTGFRAGECAAIAVAHLRRGPDGRVDSVHVPHRKCDHDSGTLPLNAAAASAVEEWLAYRASLAGDPAARAAARVTEGWCKSPWLFPSRDGAGHARYETLWGWVRRLGRRAGVAVHPHQFRHYFGTRLAQNRVAAPEMRQLMGHRSVESLNRYLHADEAAQRAAVEAL